MKSIASISELRDARQKLRGSVGFVPTMGALHEGHLSLVRKSNEFCDHTIISIYVNPTQFAENEDLDSYPRALEKDINLLSKLNVDILFVPISSAMYSNNFSTHVIEGLVTEGLETISRPHFFKGVATIVAKLFNIVNPTHAFFGEKDAQQLQVIKKMVTDLNFPIEIISGPTVRESNGLAMSSRNNHLSLESRERSQIIYRSLLYAQTLVEQGERNPIIIKKVVKKMILSVDDIDIDYISVSDNENLVEIEDLIQKSVLLSVAIKIRGTRLIDNITLSLSE